MEPSPRPLTPARALSASMVASERPRTPPHALRARPALLAAAPLRFLTQGRPLCLPTRQARCCLRTFALAVPSPCQALP